MITVPVTWQIDLRERPRILWLEIRAHGIDRQIERYSMAELWQLHYYYDPCELRVWRQGEGRPEHSLVVPARAISVIPPDSISEYVLSTPSKYIAVHFRLDESVSDFMETIDAVGTLKENSFWALKGLENAVAHFANRPWRSEAFLWELLFELVEHDRGDAGGQSSPLHSAVVAVRQRIELDLNQPQSISGLAKEVHMSPGHLLRLFQDNIGTSVRQYLTNRRMERASNLLIYTDKPIKSIAAEVGLPDLHLFNKTIRRHFGASPREVRARQTK